MVEPTKEHKKHLYIDFKKFEKGMEVIINILKNGTMHYDGICAIPRGGLIPGVYLSHHLNLPLVNSITDKSLIVEDICDKGKTLSKYEDNDKVALVAKTTGLQKIDNLIVAYETDDNVWVDFWWETKEEIKNKGKLRVKK